MAVAAYAQQAGAEATIGPKSDQEQERASAEAAPAPSGDASGIADIVVTARRSNESAQRVPIAITTLTTQGLKDLSVRDIIEIQKVTPGLYLSSQGTGGRVKLTIRGQSEADSRLTTDGSVAVYVDGVPLVRNYGLRSSLVDIAQIEVLKGPQGTLFGKNSTGGALNITTQHPTYKWSGYADFVYGSYNNVQALGVVNAPIVQDRLALRLVGQVISREGYGHLISGKDIGDDNVVTGRALLRADPTDNLNILLSADYVRQRNAGTNVVLTKDAMLQNGNSATGALGAIAAQLGLNPASATDRLTAYNAWRSYYDRYQSGNYQDGYGVPPVGDSLYDNLDHYGFSGTVAIDLGPVTVTSITAYRRLKRFTHQDTDGTPFYILTGDLSTHQRNFSQELRLTSIDGVGLDWQLGLFYNRETGKEFAANNNNTYVNNNRASVVDADIVNVSKAVYAQAVYNFSNRFRVTGGIRYTRDTREMNSHNRIDPAYAIQPLPVGNVAKCNLLSPALGGPVFPNCSYAVSTKSSKPTWLVSADWKPTDSVMVYASVSTGYRSGGFTYTGSSAVQPSVSALQAAYTPFEPETVTNYEVGFKSDFFNRRLRVNGAFYYQDYKNIQRSIRDLVNGVFVTLIRNAATAKFYGGELEVTAAPTDQLTLTAGAAYLHTKYDEFFARDSAGNLLDLSAQPFPAPKWTYNLGATYKVPLADGDIRLNANWSWIGDVNFQPGTPGVPLTTYDPGSLSQKAYGLLDARISWHIESAGLDLAVFGKNLTDKRYLIATTNGQALGFNIGFPGDPRVFGVQARKTF